MLQCQILSWVMWKSNKKFTFLLAFFFTILEQVKILKVIAY